MRIFVPLLLFLLWFNKEVYSQVTLEKVNDKATFNTLGGFPLTDKYGQVTAIKVVYDLQMKQLHFINSQNYTFHYEFCYSYLNYSVELNDFNKANYSDNEGRRFLLGNINHFRTLDKYVLDISSLDLMGAGYIIELYKQVSSSAFFGKKLQFLINTPRLQGEQHLLALYMPTISPADIYSTIDYQAISLYKGQGILKFIANFEAEKSTIRPTDIIILKETPLYLPHVAGIISTEFQTPLSHLSILGRNRKIPISAYKKAFESKDLLQLANKPVSYVVTHDTLYIKPLKSLQIANNKLKKITLDYNLQCDSLVTLTKTIKKGHTYIGHKAANFAILSELSKKGNFKTPESAFAIPFYFYNSHIIKSQAQKLIENLLARDVTNLSDDSLQLYLKNIRKTITQYPLDSTLLTKVTNKITSLGTYKAMRFRSSTNAEDANGFSGAGLYASHTGIIDSKDKPIATAIKKVWASLWSYEAFMERTYYAIKHQEVYMGILVHRSFPNEAVNGVAITKNIYRKSSIGFVVNAQLGDESVVNPATGVSCDQFICYPNNNYTVYRNRQTIDIITLSSLNKNRLVMSETEIQNLANQLNYIKKHFFSPFLSATPYSEFGLDIEFKLDTESRQLYIKQVRPYPE